MGTRRKSHSGCKESYREAVVPAGLVSANCPGPMKRNSNSPHQPPTTSNFNSACRMQPQLPPWLQPTPHAGVNSSPAHGKPTLASCSKVSWNSLQSRLCRPPQGSAVTRSTRPVAGAHTGHSRLPWDHGDGMALLWPLAMKLFCISILYLMVGGTQLEAPNAGIWLCVGFFPTAWSTRGIQACMCM